uniref:Uncharacterized protein n=1 Tax=Rhizophora mucronata TaxID=61149 RepID=A0A2P2Q8B5_RHIMU
MFRHAITKWLPFTFDYGCILMCLVVIILLDMNSCDPEELLSQSMAQCKLGPSLSKCDWMLYHVRAVYWVYFLPILSRNLSVNPVNHLSILRILYMQIWLI